MANFDLNGLKRFNTEDRNLYLIREIDEDSVSSVVRSLNNIMLNDEKLIRENNMILQSAGINVDINNYKIPTVTLHIDSYGGYIYDCFGLYDTMCSAPFEVNTIGYGKVMSAAIPIFLSGNDRYCYPNTTFMIHSVSSGSYGQVKTMEENVAESKRLNDMMFSIITSRTKITSDELFELYEKKKDWYLTVDEALNFGIVTKIITNKRSYYGQV